MPNTNQGPAEAEDNSLAPFQALIRKWDEERTNQQYDPTETLNQMSEILEKETGRYLASDPDPFEDRHPSRVNPDCSLGILLKNFFKKESLVQDLFNNYMRENYWSRQGSSKNPFDVNVAASRLILDILPGLEVSVLSETDGLVARLYDWMESAREPLMCYATGLLAVAMELSEVATDPENRTKNTRLVPVMLDRLRSLKKEAQEQQDETKQEFRRPFALFAKSPLRDRRPSKEAEGDNSGGGVPKSELRSVERLNPGWPSQQSSNNTLRSPPYANGDWSNSSWAEMERHVIGHLQIHPVTLTTKQTHILRFLTPLGEYQEFLPYIFDHKIPELLDGYVNVRETKDGRLCFEALRFLSALFCHKKFVIEWVTQNHIQLLLEVPRPSMSANAVAQCLYYISCDDDSMEKICLLPQHVLTNLVKYMLWCIECAHESGQQFGIMFFGTASSFRVLLDIIDEQDGLRKLCNRISMLPIINGEDAAGFLMTDDEEFLQRQTVRQCMVSMKRYIEAHLAIKAEQLRRAHRRETGASPQPGHSVYKAARFTPEQVAEQVEVLMDLMPFRSRWSAVDNFIGLGAVTTCLKVIAIAYDWTFQGRAEMVRSALDILAIASVIPKVQLQFCERIDLPDDTKTIGINILLGAVEGEIVQDSADVQRSALSVIINCVCAPISRPGGSIRLCATGSTVKRKPTGKTSEDLINKVWDCVRSNNGIMALLQLLHIKTPITDADSIRALACRALVGLARSEAAKQIMSKLPIFTNGQLQLLVREPVLQDKRGEHVKFQHYAHQLLELVSGPEAKPRLTGDHDFSLEMLHRASVVAQTKIRFSKKQLLQLMHEYLSSHGLTDAAGALQREAGLTPRPIARTTPTPVPNVVRTPIRHCLSPVVIKSNTAAATATPTSSTPGQLSFRVNRTSARKSAATEAPRSAQKSAQYIPRVPNSDVEKEPTISLDSIVRDYLSSQHSLCKNPMSTCPEFDLFAPHKCPDPRSKNSAPINFAGRLTRRSIYPPYGGPEGFKLDRKLVYSRFRPIKALRSAAENDHTDNIFTCCAVTHDDQFLLAGTYMGDVKLFNMFTSAEEATYQCHDSQIHHIQPSRDGRFVLTSSTWRTPYSAMWYMGEFFESKLTFQEEDYVEFSKLTEDKIIGTKDNVAVIYDVSTGEKIRELKPQISNNYTRNRATFCPTDELVLNDGVLYDMRTATEIRKLDKLNQTLSGVFHPNGLEIVSNTEVWDLRTFHLLRTVPGLDQCQPVFTKQGDIIYGVALEQETEDGEKYESAFKTFDALDYSSIATIETRRSIHSLFPCSNDQQLAVVENVNLPGATEESVVRLYDVGRRLADEEDLDEDDGEPGNDEEDDGDDSDSDNDDNRSFDSGEFEDLLGGSSGDGDFRLDDDNEMEEDNEENDDEDNEDNEDDNEDDNEGENDAEVNSNGSWEDLNAEEVIGDAEEGDEEEL